MIALLVIGLLGLGGPAHLLQPGEIRDTVRQYVLAHVGVPAADVVIEFHRIPESFALAGAPHRLQIDGDGVVKLRGNVCLPVHVVQQGSGDRIIIVTFSVRTFGPAVFAAQAIARHERIGGSTVAVRRVETTSLPKDVLVNAGTLDGMRTKRAISEGIPVCAGMLEPVPLFGAGDPVTVLVKAGNVTLSVKGVAREDGRKGDVVIVQKEGSHDRVKARVIDARTVEVNAD